jgi:aminopeptidase N
MPTGAYQSNRERSFNILHYRAELSFDFENARIRGHSTVRLALLRAISTIGLDAIGLEVESVVMDPGGDALEFETRDNSLEIKLPRPGNRGSDLTLSIGYRATPRAGMYFQPDREAPGRYFVSTYGEGGLHANWLPIYGDVNDKFSTEMIVTVPEPYKVISNGELLEARAEDSGDITYHWLQQREHSGYLISLYIGDFERGDLEPAFGEIPVRYWVPRGRLAEGAYAFRNTTLMLEYFSDQLGYRYPWVKYDQIAVPDYAIGAMEHTGVTGHNASVLRLADAPVDFGTPTFEEYFTDWSAEATISHELAHHWFGNNLTCRNLSYLWLNESFASYLMMLWDEKSVGRDQLDFDVDLARRHYLAYVDEQHIIRALEHHYFDDPDTIYNEEHTYLKGAAVLHQLRWVLGDDDFFDALTYYLHKHEFASVDSTDLKIAIEEATVRNLEWFWADWITGGGHARFEVGYRYLSDRQKVDLTVTQVQPEIEGQGLFKLPVEITLVTPSGRRSEVSWLDGKTEHLLLDSDEEPLLVSFDGGGYLVAEIAFDKEPEELAYQAAHDRLPGRLRALRQLAGRYSNRAATADTLAGALSGDRFWGERAEAARLLGSLRSPRAEMLAAEALADDDYRVRKAAVLALGELGTPTAAERLVDLVRRDPHSDVVGAAIVALATADPDTDAALLEEQLGRDSWHDEIRIAALEAIGKLDREEFVPLVRPFTSAEWNEDVRRAAARAWKKMSPTDANLHITLIDMARSPSYNVQKFGIENLGSLYVTAAVPWLEELVAAEVDPNLTVLARTALEEIRRIVPEAEKE